MHKMSVMLVATTWALGASGIACSDKTPYHGKGHTMVHPLPSWSGNPWRPWPRVHGWR